MKCSTGYEMLKSGLTPSYLHGRDMVTPLASSKSFTTFAPELQNNVPMKKFLSDMKQSAPWWLMLILQVVEAIIQYLTNNPT